MIEKFLLFIIVSWRLAIFKLFYSYISVLLAFIYVPFMNELIQVIYAHELKPLLLGPKMPF